ncbi:hypothetical protein DPMN_078313 [Dreissena polymorpha]|uniref:Uncharacterized protein n=1 Tax=Dreissena polymorpha TaxID=45954 RepID=A0A9D3YNK5_DREPO|nr:hypothetical protein DPMN_078313 [Dreissena polymorpha]
MGDSNAKIGSDKRGYEEIMRKQRLDEMNDNGERFADLAPQVTWSSEEVFSITEGYTRQLGCHQTFQWRTISTNCASQ